MTSGSDEPQYPKLRVIPALHANSSPLESPGYPQRKALGVAEGTKGDASTDIRCVGVNSAASLDSFRDGLSLVLMDGFVVLMDEFAVVFIDEFAVVFIDGFAVVFIDEFAVVFIDEFAVVFIDEFAIISIDNFFDTLSGVNASASVESLRSGARALICLYSSFMYIAPFTRALTGDPSNVELWRRSIASRAEDSVG